MRWPGALTLSTFVLTTACDRAPYSTNGTLENIQKNGWGRACVLALRIDPNLRRHGPSILEHAIKGPSFGNDETLRARFAETGADNGVVADTTLWVDTMWVDISTLSLNMQSDVRIYSKNLEETWRFHGVSIANLAGLNPLTWFRGLGPAYPKLPLYAPYLMAYTDFVIALLAEDVRNEPRKRYFSDYRDPPDGIAAIYVSNAAR